jgi:hypothetical protein
VSRLTNDSIQMVRVRYFINVLGNTLIKITRGDHRAAP